MACVPSCTLPQTAHCQPQHTAHFTQTHYHTQCPLWPVCPPVHYHTHHTASHSTVNTSHRHNTTHSALCGPCALLHITTHSTVPATAHSTLHIDTLPHTMPCVVCANLHTAPCTKHSLHYLTQCPVWPVCLLHITTHSTLPDTGHSTLYIDTPPHTMPCVVCAPPCTVHTASCTTHSLHYHA